MHEHSEKIATHDDHDYEYEEMPVEDQVLPDVAFLNTETAIELIDGGAALIHEHPHDHEDAVEADHSHAHEHSQKVPTHEHHAHVTERLSPLSPPVRVVKILIFLIFKVDVF